MITVGRVGVLAAAALVLAGCSGGGPVDGTTSTSSSSSSPSSPSVPGLSADLVQQRSDVETGKVQVELTLAEGVAAVDVVGVQLRSADYPDAGPGRALVLPPGFTIDVPVALGAPACPAAAAQGEDGDGDAPVAVVSLRDGSTTEVALPDARGDLADAHTTACAEQRATGVVPARWDPAWTTTGSGADLRAAGVLHLGPVAAGHTAVLREVGSTPLFRWRLPDGGAPVALEAGQSADVVVVLDPARCDAHAVADDKRGFGPQLSLALDGADPVLVRVWVPRSDRSTPTDALLTACAAGGGTA